MAWLTILFVLLSITLVYSSEEKLRQRPHQDTLIRPSKVSRITAALKMNEFLERAGHELKQHVRTKAPGGGLVSPVPNSFLKPKEFYGCEICIAFWTQALNNLIQIIGDIGVGGGCSAICGELPQEWEQEACFLFCQIVGSEYFGELVNDIDPDPIWNCMELYACPSAANATGNITSIKVSPTVGPLGTTFSVTATYKLFSTIGTGQVLFFFVAPQGGFEFYFSNNIIGQLAGTYASAESFDSTPTEEAPFYDGTYTVFAEICEGTCGGTHSGEYQIALGAALFNMVN